MFKWKKQPRPEYIENKKPTGSTYHLIWGRDLKIGMVIVHNNQRCVVYSISPGKGAGSLDFGEYIAVQARKLTGQVGHLDVEFWTFENCPMIEEQA